MDARIGIAKSTFLTMVTYAFVILIGSAGLITAAFTGVSVLLVQGLAFLLLPLLSRHIKGPLVTFMVLLFTALCAWGMGVALALYLPMVDIAHLAFPLPGMMFLLILVPLLLDQAKNSKEYPAMGSMKLAALFVFMLMLVSSLRELLGSGTLGGIRILTAGSEPVPFLRSLAGAACLLLFFTVILLFLYRTKTGTNRVLAVIEETEASSDQPILVRSGEVSRAQTAILSLLILLLSSGGMVCILYFVPREFIGSGMLFVAAVLLQGIFSGMFYLSLGKGRAYFGGQLASSWFMAMQTWAILLPFMYPISDFIEKNGVVLVLFMIFILEGCLWCLLFGILLFRRALRRKLIFGRRPDILTGLPFLLLFVALFLILLTGFDSIPQNIFTSLHHIT